LYSKPACHLCEEAAGLLRLAARERAFDLSEIMVDEEIKLRDRYGQRVPVLQRLDTSGEIDWPFELGDIFGLLA
jgi:hypothetical protein